MRIAFDAKRITHNATGLGNYSRFVVNGLSSYYPANDYLLYTPSPGREVLRSQVVMNSSVRFVYPGNFIYSRLGSLWRSWLVTRDLARGAIDIFHGLSNELPFNIKQAGFPSIVTIHDLIFLRYPRFYKPHDRAMYEYKFRKACREATRVIAVSEQTRRDIINFLGINPDKISVLYQGCNPVFALPLAPGIAERVAAKYQLPEKIVLYVGSIESRKNLMIAVKAIKHVDPGITLVAVGRETEYARQVKEYIKSNSLTNRVKLFTNVPFDDLPAFYKLASVFVYPSFFEGFGIPLLEALSAGTPVIAATGSCLEEAGGSGSLYFNPTDERQLAEYINEVSRNPALAEKMVLQGKEHLKKFEPRVLTAQMLSLYREVAGT